MSNLEVDVPVGLTLRQRRRDALGQDAVLFCLAFSAGAAVYAAARMVADGPDTFWSIGLSEGLVLSGLIAGEIFLLWNNGLRQGRRGHSIGKHRHRLRVVDAGTGRPTGPLRGLARGLVMVGLLDLALAAVPIGLPTVLRSLTPEPWRVGGFAYLALIVLIVPLLLPTDRGVADRVLRTRVEIASGAGAKTSPRRRTALRWLDVVAIGGVLAVTSAYIAFFWPLIWRVPSLW
ncbi:hypothetical protein HMPREF0063_10854 [Aeromicrobium marinum DSM 15272]|uniref:RDD family protein n=1 Tax=Aeromicrobium marinum DSM 15272 TaxID=585531 RepID=E2SA64_9ACTN|nr:RDD family protein [Aeromicrobium marinum]EFQ84138.1 hypothetical protein HMPREF0063_10854 [Aeromicrobium marinum DSM 15272]